MKREHRLNTVRASSSTTSEASEESRNVITLEQKAGIAFNHSQAHRKRVCSRSDPVQRLKERTKTPGGREELQESGPKETFLETGDIVTGSGFFRGSRETCSLIAGTGIVNRRVLSKSRRFRDHRIRADGRAAVPVTATRLGELLSTRNVFFPPCWRAIGDIAAMDRLLSPGHLLALPRRQILMPFLYTEDKFRSSLAGSNRETAKGPGVMIFSSTIKRTLAPLRWLAITRVIGSEIQTGC